MNRFTEALKRKIGPLPAYVWLGFLALAVYWYRKTHASPTGGSTATDQTQQAQPDLSNVPGQGAVDTSAGGTGANTGDVTNGAPASGGGISMADLSTLISTLGGLMGGISGGGGDGGGGGGGDTGGGTDGSGEPTGTPGSTQKKAHKHKAKKKPKAPKRSRTGASVNSGHATHVTRPRRQPTRSRSAPRKPAPRVGKAKVPSRSRNIHRKAPARARTSPHYGGGQTRTAR